MLVCLGLQGWKVNGETKKCRALGKALRRIVMLPGRMDTEFFSFLLDDDHVMRYMHFPPFFFVMGSGGLSGVGATSLTRTVIFLITGLFGWLFFVVAVWFGLGWFFWVCGFCCFSLTILVLLFLFLVCLACLGFWWAGFLVGLGGLGLLFVLIVG